MEGREHGKLELERITFGHGQRLKVVIVILGKLDRESLYEVSIGFRLLLFGR